MRGHLVLGRRRLDGADKLPRAVGALVDEPGVPRAGRRAERIEDLEDLCVGLGAQTREREHLDLARRGRLDLGDLGEGQDLTGGSDKLAGEHVGVAPVVDVVDLQLHLGSVEPGGVEEENTGVARLRERDGLHEILLRYGVGLVPNRETNYNIRIVLCQ